MTALPRAGSRLQMARSGLADSTEFPNSQRAACYDLVKGMFGLKNVGPVVSLPTEPSGADMYEREQRNGRIISPPFESLPQKEGNESYYRAIPDPRSMRMVLERLGQNGYPTARDVYVDLKLCFSNWSFICSRTSRDWQDTVKMDQTVDERWEVQANDGNLPTVDEMFPDEPNAAPLQASNRSTSPEDAPIPTPAPAVPAAATPAAVAGADVASPAAPPAQAAAKRERADSPSSEASVPSRPSKKPRRDSGDMSRADSPSAPTPMGAAFATTPLLERPRVNDTGSAWLVAPPANSVTVESIMASMLSSIREERDHSLPRGTGLPLLARLPELQRLPDRTANSSYFQKVMDPVSLEMVELRVRNNQYSDPADFDKDLHSAFRSAAVYFRDDPIRLGAVFLLQRLYQELTKGDGRKGGGGKSSVAAGPGTATPAATGAATSGVATPASASKVRPSEQVLLHEVKYKEDVFRVGDFVHLMNPDDCTKPIIGQIFKLWKDPASTDRHVHVCWYYRPEQTVHIPTRRFIENEVFRSYSFVDHAVEDVLERCLVMFHTRFLRGRPKAPYWTPTMPTYICEHRYKEDSKSFKKIKNWTSCIPVELRDQDEDANFTLYPTPLPNQSLRRVPSPFLRGEKGPGGVGHGEGMDVMDKEQWKYHASESRPQQQAPPPQQQQQQRPVQQPSSAGPGVGQAHQEQARPSDPTKIVRLGKDMTSMPELAARQEHFDKLPESLSKHFRTDPGDGELLWFAAPPIKIAPRDPVRNSLAYLDFVAKTGPLPATNGAGHAGARVAGQDAARTGDESVEQKQTRLLRELVGRRH